jgi:Asp-tRNA(Asn)/Glu-tRNA(Gln) amidotransferase A subunit family amidase
VRQHWNVPDAPTATALAAAVRAGRADPVELVERALARIEECDGELGAFVHIDRDGALQEAEQRRREGREGGPLHGVPIAVKDLFDVAGQRTSAGSRVPVAGPAGRDAVAVARMREAGAVVLGRTRTHEFAWGLTTWHPDLGGTRNPWDTGRTAGGSSGGSAAAVAAGVVPLALGTDTGCSIRLPAAWCGLVGHKPTHGTVPLEGVVPLAPSLDCVGALGRTVEDVLLAGEVLSGRRTVRPDLPALRVGRVAGPGLPAVVAAAVDAVVSALEPVSVQETVLPLARHLPRIYAVVQGSEAVAVHRATGRWPEHASAYGADVRSRLERAASASETEVAEARALREELRRAVDGLLDGLDLLVLPVAACGPSRTDDPDRRPDGHGPLRTAVLPWTVLANLCGLPACTVPAGVDEDGLPVGVQLVGRRGADGLVLAAAGCTPATSRL